MESTSTEAETFKHVEILFEKLILIDDVDLKIAEQDSATAHLAKEFNQSFDHVLSKAFSGATASHEAALVAHRILYRINRLNLFWYDDLNNYKNESSLFLQSVRQKAESAWMSWETNLLNLAAMKAEPFEKGLRRRAERDVLPLQTPSLDWVRMVMTSEQYKKFLCLFSFDALIEASQMSRVMGGASGLVQSTIMRIFTEEYGAGRLDRKHSSYFKKMMEEVGLRGEPEHYFQMLPWEVIASTNFSFWIAEYKKNFLRYIGALTHIELVVPSVFDHYQKAAERLGFAKLKGPPNYWQVHIVEDERHGKWMVEDAALHLAEHYPHNAWEILLGYDQQELIGNRAAAAMWNCIRS